MESEKISIYHDVVGHHFEVQLEDVKAIVDYDEHMDTLALHYTHIPEQLLGKGIFGPLTEKLIQYLREQRYKVIPVDTIFRRYFTSHPEHKDLISETCLGR